MPSPYSPRITAALAILGPTRTVFTVHEYQCDPEQCGHSDSIILRAPGYIGVCFSLEDLQRYVDTLDNTFRARPDLKYAEAARLHFLGTPT